MSNNNSTCQYSANPIRFRAYVVTANLEYRPDSGDSVQHFLQFRYENPERNAFNSRVKAIRKARYIKRIMDDILAADSGSTYNYEGVELILEYEIAQLCKNDLSEVRRLYLLDGEIGDRQCIYNAIASEEFVLDMMDYSFVRIDFEQRENLEYSQLVDELFDCLVELDKPLVPSII